MSLRGAFWRVRFASWLGSGGRFGGGSGFRQEGYTLLLPVPGDLPVFLQLALAVCALQDPAHRVETLVIPDRLTPAVRRIVADAAPGWPGALHLVPLPALDRIVLPRLADAGRNHGAQLIRGVRRARAERVLLHDADLFLMDPQAHADEYVLAAKEDLDVLGVSPAWDPWFADRGQQLVATWEQLARVSWFRSFPPHRHLGHDAVVDGERHTFDTTFWPQFHSPPAGRAVGIGLAGRTVHFNYTVSTYRLYAQHLRRSSEPFHDSNFRIMLIRLFTELFGSGEPGEHRDDVYGLPSLDELAAGLGPAAAGGGARGSSGRRGVRVRYAQGDAAEYRRMRAGLAAVVAGPWSSAERTARCQRLLAGFDAYFRGLP